MKLDEQFSSASKNILKATTAALVLAGCTDVAGLQRQIDELKQAQNTKVVTITGKDVQVVSPTSSATPTPSATATAKPIDSVETSEVIERTFELGQEGKLDRIDVQGNLGNLTIEVLKEGEKPSLKIRGDKRLLDDVQATAGLSSVVRGSSKGITTINGRSYIVQNGSSGNIISSGYGSVVTGNGVQVINGQVYIGGRLQDGNQSQDFISSDGVPVATLSIPKGTQLEVDAAYGSLQVGDTEGPVDLHVSSSKGVTLGKITSLTLHHSGTGDIKVSAMNGDLNFHGSGTGDLSIDAGVIPNADIDFSGVGNVSIYASIGALRFSASGVGNFTAPHVTKVLSQHNSGVGKVRIN